MPAAGDKFSSPLQRNLRSGAVAVVGSRGAKAGQKPGKIPGFRIKSFLLFKNDPPARIA